MNNKDSFSYTYSAEKQEEIKRIREKYLPKEADRMQQIRDLDKSVTTKGTVLSLILGVHPRNGARYEYVSCVGREAFRYGRYNRHFGNCSFVHSVPRVFLYNKKGKRTCRTAYLKPHRRAYEVKAT